MKINFKPKSNPVSDADRAAKLAEGGFGKYYSDNMIIAEWDEKSGWVHLDRGCCRLFHLLCLCRRNFARVDAVDVSQ